MAGRCDAMLVAGRTRPGVGVMLEITFYRLFRHIRAYSHFFWHIDISLSHTYRNSTLVSAHSMEALAGADASSL